MKNITITTVKRYTATYYVGFGYNGVQIGLDIPTIERDVDNTAKFKAYEKFVEDTNRSSRIPTPKMSECKFDILYSAYDKMNESEYRVYTYQVKVTWDYIKE